MNRQQTPRSPRHAPAMCLVLCVGGIASPAMAGTRAGVDVALSGKVSTNPYNASNPGPAVVAISPSVAPWLTYEDPNTTVELRGNVLVDQYTRTYGRNTNSAVQLNVQQVMSSTFTLRAGAGYFDSNVGLHDILLARATAADAILPPGTPLPDVTTAGLRTRTRTISGNVGADWKMSTLDSLAINFSGALSRSNASGSTDFVNETAYLGYNRQLTPRTIVTASVLFNNVDYLRTTQGDGTIVNPQVGITRQFSSHINLGINLGVSIANFSGRGTQQNNFTVLAGSLHLCDVIEYGQICLNAGRSAQPTALGGISTSSDISLALDRRFGRSNTISVTARFSRAEQTNELFGFRQDFAGLMVTYTRKFSDRFSAFVTPSYSKTFDNIASRASNFELLAGIRCRFGAIR